MRTKAGAGALVAAVAALLASQACSSRPAPRASAPPASPAGPSGPSATAAPSGAASGEAPISVESNPPGDIPDSVQFIRYGSPTGGYSLEVPEGWARSESGGSVTFADKLTSIRVEVQPATQAPTPDTVRTGQEPALAGSVRAFKELGVEAATLPAGPAVLLRYQANSDPDAITGKQVRLEVDRYAIFKGARLVVVSLSAPAGSDNVDVWRRVSRSVRIA